MPITLPKELEKYSETKVFNEQTVPAKLKSEHSTKPGVWGKLVVLTGTVDYVTPGTQNELQCVRPGQTAIIEPTVVHFVRLSEDATFKVEFFKAP